MGSLTRLLIAAHLLSIVICAKKSKAIQSLGFLTDSDISRVGGVYPCLFKTDVTGLILGATAGGLVDLDIDTLLEGVLGSLNPMLGFLSI